MKTLFIRVIAIILVILPVFSSAAEINQKPFVIPELKQWAGKNGLFRITESSQIIVPKGNSDLRHVAKLFALDYKTMFGKELTISEGKANKGDFTFTTASNKELGKEGYQIKISDLVEITAPQSIGVFWATRTLLQMSEQSKERELPKGEIKDWPDYELRGFMIDCGRKFIPLQYLRDYVKIMAYYKMNTFQIHLNDNGFKQYFENDWNKTYSAFRLESETFPGLAAQDGYYTKSEFIDLQKLAEEYFVEIIPEIDVPAHSLAFSQYKPEIGSTEYGMDHLDLFNPETYKFIDALFKEYLEGENPVFRGKRVHVGTDEYSNKKKDVIEKFRYFTDYCIRLVEGYGKQACVWGALTHANGETPVKSENVLMLAWHNPYAQPDSMIEQGYDLVSIPDGLLYIVPNAGYYYDYLNHNKIYNEWTPAQIGNKVFSDNEPKIKGGMFAVWNDHAGNGISTKDIHHRVFPAIQTLSTKMWTGKSTTLPFEVFDLKRQNLSEAPGINILGKIGTEPTLVYEQAEVKKGDKMKYKEIGYNYTVSFELDGANEKKGTVLFSNDETQFYLSDPIKGMLGFARDGYLNTFNYRVKDGEKVLITVCGDNKGTRLYINGKLHDNLSIKTQWYSEGKDKMYYIQTLVFPLDKAGDYNSTIRNFKVYNYCKE